jgi:CheY-like chemotaxis protein
VAALRSAGKLDAHRLSVEARPVWVDADPVRLEQIVTNLLANAVKYTPAGGNVTVGTERSGAQALLRVEDDGVGMPAETLPRVFELFFQASGALSPQGGLGLGLNLVHRLVELHGGTVEASSAGPGRGASFLVRLPSIPPPSVPEPWARATAESRARGHVLVIEDNADVRESLVLILEQAGYRVTCAGDGPGGVEAALRSRPEVMLVDVGLPGFDGHEVARRVRAAPESASTLLVALTGYGQEQDQRQARAAGFDLHLVKPVDPERLLALLAERTGSRRG